MALNSVFRLLITLPICLSAPAASADTNEIRFTGALSQVDEAGNDQILRRFEVILLSEGETGFFSVLDDESEGCPWPESFGRIEADMGAQPRVLYRYDESQYSLPLPPLHVALPDDGTSWQLRDWTYEIAGPETIKGVAALRINATERRGRRLTLHVETATGLVLQARQDVFMGRGDRFQMTLQKASTKEIADNALSRASEVAAELLSLQSVLDRRPDSQSRELSPRQITDAEPRLENLQQVAEGTPFHESVLRMINDVGRQKRRVALTMNREKQLLNQPAPRFALNLVDGGSLSSEAMTGKVTVLHFWTYSEKLTEPYGQVGYLEFLSNKRKNVGLQVVGVACNPALQVPDSVARARRSARRLVEFMNLNYSVGYDDGSLLRAFGDPRDNNGELPLWVVVSADGKVVHYQTGFYEVDRERGLKDLDDVVIAQIKAAAAK